MEALIIVKRISVVAFAVLLIFQGSVLAKSSLNIKASYLYNDSSSNLIKVFPSSSSHNNKTILTFTVVNPSKISIKIYDVEGREIAYLMNKDVPAGTFELYLETKNLRKGMYYCKFFTGEKVAMKKMITVSQ